MFLNFTIFFVLLEWKFFSAELWYFGVMFSSILRGELEGDLEAHTFPKAIYAFLELLRRYIIHTVTHTLAIFQDLETPLSDEIKESLVPPPALGCT